MKCKIGSGSFPEADFGINDDDPPDSDVDETDYEFIFTFQLQVECCCKLRHSISHLHRVCN
jgi:hypothetical protein